MAKTNIDQFDALALIHHPGNRFHHADIGKRTEPKGEVFDHFQTICQEDPNADQPMNLDDHPRVGKWRLRQDYTKPTRSAWIDPVSRLNRVTPKCMDTEIFASFASRVPKDGTLDGLNVVPIHRVESITPGKRFARSILPPAATVQGDHDTRCCHCC